MSSLIRSRLSLTRFNVATIKHGRFLYTESNKVEAEETVNIPTQKLPVPCENGFVGSHVCKGLPNRGPFADSLSRTGTPSIQRSWANNGIWNQGNLLSTDSWKGVSKGVTSVALTPGFLHGTRCIGSMPGQDANANANTQAHQAPSFRPLSPHLTVYKPQISSTLSISHRISYVVVLSVAMLSYLVCLKMGPILLSHSSFYQFLFYSSKIAPVVTDVTGLALLYLVVHHFISVYGQMKWLRK